ncbi:MAG: hypothetical protein QOI24_2766 [Acidobacteriota bacterium]|nr:hypothetical protein [Acidobacteriota bacterium]
MPESSWAELDVLPGHLPWRGLRSQFVQAVHSQFEHWISRDQRHYRDQLMFALGRFDEGVRLLSHLRHHILADGAAPLTVLDIGAGNGGVAIAFANDPRNRVIAADLVPNPQAVACRKLMKSPVAIVAADGAQLPVLSNSVDLVLLVDVLEHLPSAGEVASEIMRVLRNGGLCVMVTPARLAHVVKPDPHYGVRGLLLLPNAVQRFIVDRVLKRRIVTATGTGAPAYDVEHTFWHAAEIAALFPEPKTVDVLYEQSFAPPPPVLRFWLREPQCVFAWLHYRLRRFFFGHILVYKNSPPEGTPAFDRLTSRTA